MKVVCALVTVELNVTGFVVKEYSACKEPVVPGGPNDTVPVKPFSAATVNTIPGAAWPCVAVTLVVEGESVKSGNVGEVTFRLKAPFDPA